MERWYTLRVVKGRMPDISDGISTVEVRAQVQVRRSSILYMECLGHEKLDSKQPTESVLVCSSPSTPSTGPTLSGGSSGPVRHHGKTTAEAIDAS